MSEQKGKEREKREVPVPKTHLERIGLAVSGGREVEDTPLGEPGDGVYSGEAKSVLCFYVI
ncbi:hypothetical protein IGI04_029243 [Brassica rapa subsp. trilocularis]|uniref:Uncharacterized protein n=1 Tax=Brassica rapa subsp. trilocularis TaxID=1813537 RepID=A0ABQ7LPP1_BRACM|nr:hypothetical protein IGI04_029243 [Brassica rapa subsp. trilocularis]